jgi:hypothetical protein
MVGSMSRPPRIQFAGAIYHIVTRGDGRRALFRNLGHYERFSDGLRQEVERSKWVAYDQLHAHWQTAHGGRSPDQAYRKYVREGMNFSEDPFKQELREWVFGSEDFLRRMIALAEGSRPGRHQSTSRRLKSVSVDEILQTVAAHHGVSKED